MVFMGRLDPHGEDHHVRDEPRLHEALPRSGRLMCSLITVSVLFIIMALTVVVVAAMMAEVISKSDCEREKTAQLEAQVRYLELVMKLPDEDLRRLLARKDGSEMGVARDRRLTVGNVGVEKSPCRSSMLSSHFPGSGLPACFLRAQRRDTLRCAVGASKPLKLWKRWASMAS